MKLIATNCTIFIFGVLLITSCYLKGSGNVVRVERTVPSFNSVKSEGSYSVYLKQDSVFKVEVESDDNLLSHIKTEVSDNTLIIKNKGRKIFKKTTKLNVYISAPSYSNIILWGSGTISSENSINTSYLNVDISGSGNIKLEGFTDKLRSQISGSGNMEAVNLIAKDADGYISGSGYMILNVQNTLDAHITGSGNITYSGNPAVHETITGSGKVIKN